MRRFITLVIVLAAALTVAACGENVRIPTLVPTPDRPTTVTPETTELPSPVLGPGSGQTTARNSAETPVIGHVALHVADSESPPRYFAKIRSLHISVDCHALEWAGTRRSGTEIAVSAVYVIGDDIDCPPTSSLSGSFSNSFRGSLPPIFQHADLVVDLGSDFEPGVTYTLRVNEITRTFATGLGVTEMGEAPAPVRGVTVNVDEADPPQYAVEFALWTPFTCDTFDATTNVHRSGTGVEVSVVNRVVDDDEICSRGGRREQRSLSLGSDFEPGATYTVRVNDWESFFMADPDAFRPTAIGDAVHRIRPTHSESGGLAPPRAGHRDGDEYRAEAPQPIPRQFPPLFEREALSFSRDHTVVRATESDPPNYTLDTLLAIPEAHVLRRVDVRKSGEKLEIRLVSRGDIEEEYEFYRTPLSVDLGTDFEPGVTYTVYSQGQVLTEFTAE